MNQQRSDWKTTIGKKLEQFSHDVFDVFRWMAAVSFAHYLAISTQTALFYWLSYVLGAVLFSFLVAVFLLRGQIEVFRGTGKIAFVGNLMLNMTLCMLSFLFILWVCYEAVDGFIQYYDDH